MIALTNGIKQELAYDNADRLLSLTYKKTDDSVIETITYTYDAKGQRLSKTQSGSGSTSSRETGFTGVYDNANRLTSLTLTGGASYTLAYDDNGNLTSKTDTANAANTTTYSWDSRNRLTGINAPGVSASFKYDALNRRVEKSVNGNTINYVYDGAQAIAEITNGSVSAAILTGLNVDEVLARYSSSGNRTYLTDGLGSVIAQASDTQAIENYYSYTPYGETQALGPDNGNPVQYTARENDGTGLYYYRARYYDPVLKRFIAEDPIGLAGGLNAYNYVDGDPVSNTDPSGNIAPAVIWVGSQYARCVAQCMAMAAIAAALPGGPGVECFNATEEAADCLLECLNPFNWGGKGKGGVGIGGKKGGKKGKSGNKDTDYDPQKKGYPGNNQAQNKKAADAATEAGGLDKAQQDTLHRQISGMDFTYKEILDIARDIKRGR